MLSWSVLWCKMNPRQRLHFKSTIKCFQEEWIQCLDLPYSFSPIECSVRINHQFIHHHRLKSIFPTLWGWTVHFLDGCSSPCFPVSWVNVGNIIQTYILIATAQTFVFLAVYWAMWTSLLHFFHILIVYRASTVLNDVFNDIFYCCCLGLCRYRYRLSETADNGIFWGYRNRPI